jgi:hypothetical protein
VSYTKSNKLLETSKVFVSDTTMSMLSTNFSPKHGEPPKHFTMSSHPNGPTLTNESGLPITDKPVLVGGYQGKNNHLWSRVLGGYQGKNNPLDQEFRPNISHDIRFVISRIENRYKNLRPKQDI